MIFFKSKVFLLITFILSIGLLWGLNKSLVYENVDFDIDGALKKEVSENGYFDKKILIAIKNENFNDVEMYEKLANYLDVNLTQATRDEIDSHNDFFSKSLRNTKEFSLGFLSGKGESAVGISGSMLSDMTVVGDLRDLSKEGLKFINDEKYDKIILGVATVGVGLSASQFLSAGSTTPLKVGASVVKVAKKTGKISKSFLNVINSKLMKTVDMKLLKTIDLSNINGIKRVKPTIAKSLKFDNIRKLFGNINKLKKNTSVFDTVTLLKYVDTEKDLKKLVKVSSKYKKNTKGVLKVLGKGAFRGSTKIVKYTTMFITELVLAILSFLGFIIGAFINLKMIFSWVRGLI
jgi:hypothetical protein